MRYLFLAVIMACVSIQASAMEVSLKNQNSLITAINGCDLEGFELLSSQGGFDPMQHARKGAKNEYVPLDNSPLSIALKRHSSYPHARCFAIIEKLIRLGADPFVATFPGGGGPLGDALGLFPHHSKEALEYFDFLISIGKLDLKKGIKLTILNAEIDKAGTKNNDIYFDYVLSEPTLLMLISQNAGGDWGWTKSMTDKPEYLNIIQRSDINANNKKGKTALMYSVKNKFALPHTQMLLENGADPSIKDSQGKTAMDYALANGNIEAAKLIRSFNSSAPAISQ